MQRPRGSVVWASLSTRGHKTTPRGQQTEYGAGSGLLEALLLHASSGGLELYGVEVASCQCPFLPDERVLRVPGTRALHADAVLASVVMFVRSFNLGDRQG